jgi:hypothetical protein
MFLCAPCGGAHTPRTTESRRSSGTLVRRPRRQPRGVAIPCRTACTGPFLESSKQPTARVPTPDLDLGDTLIGRDDALGADRRARPEHLLGTTRKVRAVSTPDQDRQSAARWIGTSEVEERRLAVRRRREGRLHHTCPDSNRSAEAASRRLPRLRAAAPRCRNRLVGGSGGSGCRTRRSHAEYGNSQRHPASQLGAPFPRRRRVER